MLESRPLADGVMMALCVRRRAVVAGCRATWPDQRPDPGYAGALRTVAPHEIAFEPLAGDVSGSRMRQCATPGAPCTPALHLRNLNVITRRSGPGFLLTLSPYLSPRELELNDGVFRGRCVVVFIPFSGLHGPSLALNPVIWTL